MIESQKFRVWNTTRDSLLCAEITVADPGHEDLDGLILSIVTKPGAGLWLRPCMGAPVAEGAPPFDLVCIDQDCRVVEQYESFLSGSFVLFQPRTSGALILPARTIAASQTKVGDVLDIMLPEEDMLEIASTAGVEVTITQDDQPSIKQRPGADSAAAPAKFSSPVENAQSESNIAETNSDNSDIDDEESKTKKKDSLSVRILRWLVPDRRNDERRASPKLTAHRWSGDQMLTYLVEDVSSTGIYVVTEERPFKGTIFMLTLKKKVSRDQSDGESISIQSKVVRWGGNGLGLEFITTDSVSSKEADLGSESGTTSIQLRRFLQGV